MIVDLPDIGMVECHCPATGRIGGLDFADSDIPCLVSSSLGAAHLSILDGEPLQTMPYPSPTKSAPVVKRRTRYTVEAISLPVVSQPTSECWIGINQSQANRYVEHFILRGKLNEILHPSARPALSTLRNRVEREVQIGRSRIDFVVNGNIFVEVKTPLIHIPCQHHPQFRQEIRDGKFDSSQRIVKHFDALADILRRPDLVATRLCGQRRMRKNSKDYLAPQRVVKSKYFPTVRCIFLLCHLYDAEPFRRPPVTHRIQAITDASKRAKDCVEFWQLNLRVDATKVEFVRLFRLPHDY